MAGMGSAKMSATKMPRQITSMKHCLFPRCWKDETRSLHLAAEKPPSQGSGQVDHPRAAARHIPSSFEEGSPRQSSGFQMLVEVFEMSPNSFQHLFKRFKYLPVFKPQDTDALLF